MATYLTVKTGTLKNGISSGETLKTISDMLVEKFNLPYECFLYPYVDWHSLYFAAKTVEPIDDILVVRADGINELIFAEEIKRLKPLCGVCWYFGSAKEAFWNTDSKIYSSFKDNSNNNCEQVCLFCAGTNKGLFSSPDYIIREYSRRLCAFFEIAVREVASCKGKIISCSTEKMLFEVEKESISYLNFRLVELFNEKLGSYLRFSNKFFNKFIDF